MKQKVIQIGNSTGVTIPKKILKEAGLKNGSSVYVEKDPNGKTIYITQREKLFNSSITPNFLDVLEKVNKRYGPALRKLAKK